MSHTLRELVSRTKGVRSLAILDQFSTPSGILKAGMDRVLNTMEKTSRNHYSAEDVKKLVSLAKETIGIPDRDGIYAFRIRQIVARLISKKKQICEIEDEIMKLTKGDENMKRIVSIDEMKGIGPVNAPAMVSEIGDIYMTT